MSIKAIMIICWWAAFLIGCIVAYIRHRRAKKQQDEIICKIIGRHMYQFNGKQIVSKIEL